MQVGCDVNKEKPPLSVDEGGSLFRSAGGLIYSKQLFLGLRADVSDLLFKPILLVCLVHVGMIGSQFLYDFLDLWSALLDKFVHLGVCEDFCCRLPKLLFSRFVRPATVVSIGRLSPGSLNPCSAM